MSEAVDPLAGNRVWPGLARAHPVTGRIRISARVLSLAPDDLLREILCHEAAHVAAFLRHGWRVRPHGREWQALMREAGYEPRVRLAGHAALTAPPVRPRPLRYELACPTCVRAGRSGELEVRRLGESAGSRKAGHA